jgi:ketosteroid isomerase-like protein
MSRALAGFVLLALPMSAFAGSTVTVQTSAPDGQVADLVAAERGFARMALETNIRDAFFENMANDAILFRPTPVNGKEFFRGRPANPGPVLSWYPSYAELAGSGDLGWTTGPWEYRSAKDTAPEAWGHFATVWQKQTDGKFKVLLDEGHSCARPPQDSLTWARLPGVLKDGELVGLAEFQGAHRLLLDADAGYSKLLVTQGIGAALAQYADADVRVLREDQPEYQGAAAAGKALEHEWEAGVKAWDTRAGGMSRTTDLAFTYGTVTLGEKAKHAPQGRKVFRIWRRQPGIAGWKLALDVTNAVPPPPPPPAPKKS